MSEPVIHDLRQFIEILRREKEIVTIETEVDPYLEIAEIHRRVIAGGGPALFFSKVKGSAFPVVTNLFGSARRMELAFGRRPIKFVQELVHTVETMLPPTLGKLWQKRGLLRQAAGIGLKRNSRAPILETRQTPPRLTDLPMLTSWHSDGGPFVTLPLVYTEDPLGRGHNLGMYRIQRHDDTTTGIHWQIHKGGGYHYHEAEKRNEALPMTLYIGGPPALMLAAIAPLPENIPELLLASLLLGKKLPMAADPAGGHPLVANAEFAVKGVVPPHVRRPEGPFGDHYGYNSLTHDYPIFQAQRLYHRKDAIYPATVVGRPKQEDFFIGDFLQELLSPLFPLVMSGVRQLKTFGEAGFHCLAAARVTDRYPREAFASGLRILGEGQLSLTKFLIVTDGELDVADFPALWRHVLERVDWRTDLFVFANVSQDTLDYTGPSVNSGSKAMLLGLGREPKRVLPEDFHGTLPQGCERAKAMLPGTLVVQGQSYEQEQELPARLAAHADLAEWPVVLLVDDLAGATVNLQEFIWTFFTRFEPAADIHAAGCETVRRFHQGLTPPVVFDCRMKPWYPPVLEVDPATKALVDSKIGKILPGY
ncbi:UbiD family decarboxylase [Desulfurivibrio alkaliphilus]|uniref:UbiD family decarboxylase n=1 Tax=Desulfurivibrio alkaliphilus (strain DSM 19089 / UNIQEM U267 / AHT2) TaxID=589865 RepID=D6Z0V1_DESAT|nr:UbiD family decarboxylase [Desulfurivibrio alkaliphilus]ADH87211.1 UbiD family decarboxylase [Desulfurivibrio alkaliphilus AHT 2]